MISIPNLFCSNKETYVKQPIDPATLRSGRALAFKTDEKVAAMQQPGSSWSFLKTRFFDVYPQHTFSLWFYTRTPEIVESEADYGLRVQSHSEFPLLGKDATAKCVQDRIVGACSLVDYTDIGIGSTVYGPEYPFIAEPPYSIPMIDCAPDACLEQAQELIPYLQEKLPGTSYTIFRSSETCFHVIGNALMGHGAHATFLKALEFEEAVDQKWLAATRARNGQEILRVSEGSKIGQCVPVTFS